jgi:flavodoxin
MSESGQGRTTGPGPEKTLVVVYSYHHNNTEKLARAIAGVLGARVTTPAQVTPGEIAGYDLIGFGSGIYSATFDRSLLDLVSRLPHAAGKNAFLFSTFGAPAVFAGGDFVRNNHAEMRERLEAKGYTVIGEFGCAGWNTNSFLRFFGGLNKGRPDAGDLRHAEEFAEGLKSRSRPQREIS